MTPTVVLFGTLDSKGEEYAFVRDRLEAAGVATIIVDCGTVGAPLFAPDITASEVAAAVGADLAALTAAGDRGQAVTTMARGAEVIARQLHADGRLQGLLALGGSGGTSIASAAARALPIGVPKLIVSTMAASDTRSLIGESDLMLAASVVDVAGLNSISRRVFANAAAAMVGMVSAAALPAVDERPLLAASMFGVTTPCVTQARDQLEGAGYEVLTFHMTGTGGRSMESLIAAGFIRGVLDTTTTELCDELVGGELSAGPDRLTAAGRAGIPQAVSLGALDMVNFGPRETVPKQFDDRNLYVHNDQITLMRTTSTECALLGREVAEKLTAATGPTALFIPLRGISMIATEGGPFYDPEADEALFGAVREHLGGNVELIELELDINDLAFSAAMADWLHAEVQKATA
ncbi:MAG: hypothetical protein CK540_07340 [Thermoleophilia bacterium]|nr:MAG: hypothetical protein CK540_07340 [Thermoleophilia bacterium]